MPEKQKAKHPRQNNTVRYEARWGDDAEFPLDIYSIVGVTQDEYYENSYVNIEAAREDFPGIQMLAREVATFMAVGTCPKCGAAYSEERDSKHFGEEERRCFYCQNCEIHWFQWERVENTPYKIEYEGEVYDLSEDPEERVRKAAPELLGALQKIVAAYRALQGSDGASVPMNKTGSYTAGHWVGGRLGTPIADATSILADLPTKST